MQVGAAPLHPLFAQLSDAAPMITYPPLHVNVAVEPCVFPLLRTGALPFSGALSDGHDAVGAALGIEVGAAVGIEVGKDVGVEVGTDVGVAVGTLEGTDVGDVLGAVLGAVDGEAVGTTVGEDVSHVGTASAVQLTEPTPTTLHVRVVATLIVNPRKQ